MNSLHEKHRPTSFAEVVGQDTAVKRIQAVLGRGWGGRAWFLVGGSGCGKSTLARLIAAEGAEDWSIDEIDAGVLTPAYLREMEAGYRYRGMGAKPGRAIIVNECHGLRKDTIRLLLVNLERIPAHVVWIFTTTKRGQDSLFEDDPSGDAAPLVSRCTEISLESGSDYLSAAAKRARDIAQREGIDGLPERVYREALSSCRGNLRALLQRIESGAFRDDARAGLEQRYAMIRTTKSESAIRERAEIETLLNTL